MRELAREFGFLWRQPAARPALALLAALAALAVGLGLAEVARQQAAIERVRALQPVDEAAVLAEAADAGAAAYATAHATWDAPAPLAFAALGQRDVAPYVLRVRALALEGQLHESDVGNPELALPGRFDFAFVLFYLAPLVLVALLHDLRAGERAAGRWPLLRSLPGGGARLWGARIAVRGFAAFAALALPLAVGAGIAGAGIGETLAALAIVGGAVAFWALLAGLVGLRGARPAVNAAALVAAWLAIALVAPAAGHLAIRAAVPVPPGAELAVANRDAVHAAWDRPRNDTLALFYASNPHWARSGPITTPFHWKWYFAFQQLGDEAVAPLSRAYREAIERRERAAAGLGLALPPLGLQQALHRLARTDQRAQLAYQDRVRAFHARLRGYYYGHLFEERPFDAAAAARAPRFDPAAPTDVP